MSETRLYTNSSPRQEPIEECSNLRTVILTDTEKKIGILYTNFMTILSVKLCMQLIRVLFLGIIASIILYDKPPEYYK